MNFRDLLAIESEITILVDQIEREDDFCFNSQIDGLRAIARRIGVEAELARLNKPPQDTPTDHPNVLCLSGPGGSSFHAETTSAGERSGS